MKKLIFVGNRALACARWVRLKTVKCDVESQSQNAKNVGTDSVLFHWLIVKRETFLL